MKVLFCGTYMSLNFARKLEFSSEAALKFQRNLLREFKEGTDIEVLSYIPYKDDLIYKINESEDIEGIRVRYVKKCTFKSYANILISYFNKLKSYLKNKDVIILYNYSYINIFTRYLAKKYNVKTFLILADHDDLKSEKNFLKKIILKFYEMNIKKFDGVIFLSEGLSNKMMVRRKLVIEGGLHLDSFSKLSRPLLSDKIRIMYSGSLEKVSGVDMYIDAIKHIKGDNIEFIFTGKGSLGDDIKKVSDKRIKYKGMTTEEEYYELLSNANILINSKNMNMGENKNNFPSKVLEYLATGRVVISTKFSGYSKFEKNIIFSESNVDSIARNINYAINNYNDIYLHYYDENIKLAEKFSWKNQVIKMKKFIKNEEKND